VETKYALLSVSDKSGIEDLARALAAAGFVLISSGGTASALEKEGIPVRRVSDHTGFPELLGGRVKTLHPRIHAGILARRTDPEHLAQLAGEGIPPIELVAVNLYPFREALAAGRPPAELTELIDIGGVALLRAAAKNWEDVAVLPDPSFYPEAIRQLRESGAWERESRRRWAGAAFALSAAYDAAVAGWFSRDCFPETFLLAGRLRQCLRYGENPQQAAAFYETAPASGTAIAGASLLGGKELSYNNLLDLESALGLILEFSAPAAVIVKHTNPCGCALGPGPAEAFTRALGCDPKSAFGGIVALNREVDGGTASLLAGIFLEAVIAPSFSPEALEVLRSKKNLRLLAAGPFRARAGSLQARTLYGGFLLQETDAASGEGFETVAGPAPAREIREDLLFAASVCKHVKSNAIVLAREKAIVGIGAGQMSRIDAAELALKKAAASGISAAGSVLASDAFFPFRDVVDLAAAAGIRAVIEPGGSIRDAESVAAAKEHGLTLVFTGVRHFRH